MPLIPALWNREAEAERETGRSLEFKDNQGLKIKLQDSKEHYKKKPCLKQKKERRKKKKRRRRRSCQHEIQME